MKLTSRNSLTRENFNKMRKSHTLTNGQIHRYGRHLVLPPFGVDAQARLVTSSVLIVGVGGIGSSAALYLASSGVGTIGLLDHDCVDVSNLHRQIIHCEKNQGKLKVDSAVERLKELNSTCTYVKHAVQLSTKNALEIVSLYDVVVDATDNVTTRYILNDSCVLSGKPLVSGAAVGFDGQLSVYNFKNSPCYRCRFPRPPRRGSVASCSDAGVLGPIPGLVGVLQSIETIKILANIGTSMGGRIGIFDGMDARFMVMKLNERRKDCEVCGCGEPNTTHDNTAGNMPTGKAQEEKQFSIRSMQDTLEFLRYYGLDDGMGEEDSNNALQCPFERVYRKRDNSKVQGSTNEHTKIQFNHISCADFYQELWKDIGSGKVKNTEAYLFLDVRPRHQYKICSLPLPFQSLPLTEFDAQKKYFFDAHLQKSAKEVNVYTICRRGVASQKAAKLLVDWGFKNVYNIAGGLERWQKDVDGNFPIY